MVADNGLKGQFLNRIELQKRIDGLHDPGHKPIPTPVTATQVNMKTFVDGQQLEYSVWHSKDGSVTIQCTKGKPDRLHEIVKATKLTDGKNLNVRIPSFDPELLVQMADSLPSICTGCVTTPTESPGQKSLKVVSPYGDNVRLTFHQKTGTLQIQGTHALASMHVIGFLSGRMRVGNFLQGINEIVTVPGTEDDFLSEIKHLLGDVSTFMEPEWTADMAGMLVIEKIEVNLPTYTQFVFSSMRGLEGFCKKLAHKLGIVVSGKGSQLGDLFEVSANMAVFRTCPSTSGRQMTIKQAEAMGCALGLLYGNRNPYFHAAQAAAYTQNIDTRQEAIDLNREAVNTMRRALKLWTS